MVVYTSPWEPLNIPKCNILSYLFPPGTTPSTKPIWIDADNPANSLSQSQMLTLVKRLAVGLDRIGIKEKQAVMVLSPNHLFVPVAYLAAAGSKRYFTGANPAYTTAEVVFQIKSVEAAVVFVHDSLVETAKAAARECGISLNRLYTFSAQKPFRASTSGLRDWRSILAPEEESESWEWDPLDGEIATQTVGVINFSSGTTGLPKGVCITHHNLIANSMQASFNQYGDTGYPHANPSQERWLAFLPLYHAYSQLYTINIACKLQIPVYIMPKFAFQDFLNHIQCFRITTIHSVPPVIVMLAKREGAAGTDISTLRHATCGAAPLSSDIQNDVMNRYKHLAICQGFGMSETTCVALMSAGSTRDFNGSIGHLVPNTEARLVGEDGNEVQEGEPGELLLRGPQMMLGYWKNPQATQETKDRDGWLRTGDVAVTKNGKWWIVDRKKELIKVNGLQVAPAELEAVLLESADVVDAAVVGITLHGEELPRAYVVLREGVSTSAGNIQAFVAGKVSKHKRLAGGVRFIEEVPKFASGKIIRKVVKEWAKNEAKEVEKTVKARL